MAPLSVGVQLACGVGFLTGILIRWAGLFCALNFIVAIMMVDGPAGIRPSFPSAMLVAFGLYIAARGAGSRSEEHTSELQSLMRISYAVFCLKKKINKHNKIIQYNRTKYIAITKYQSNKD